MSDMGRRVALLARPGIACDRLRGALVDAGAQVVLEADPLTLDPVALEAAQVQVVMVALDPQTEEALDRFEAVLQNSAIEVIFEEAELAATREGWEAARWARHLAAKLHRHGNVLPPGAEAATAFALEAESDLPSPFSPAGEPARTLGFEAEATRWPESATTSPPHAFDPLLAEMSFEPGARVEDGDERSFMSADPRTDRHAPDASSSLDPSADVSYDGSFAAVVAEMSAAAAPTSGFDSFGLDQDGAVSWDDLSLDEAHAEPRTASRDEGFDLMFDGDFAAAAGLDAATPATHEPDSPAAHAFSGRSEQAPALVSTDDDMAPALRGYAEPSGESSIADHRFKHDLTSLELRIAGMELDNDRIIKGPAQANGAVLVMAGIGGPDAVRQLLGALPEGFPRPVLVQQRLDGGRYDKLVAQMQRATALPVMLAEPGLPAIGGVIYILPAGVCIKLTDTGIQFTGGDDDVLAALPSADSAVLMLSGSDPVQVDAVMNHSWAGALVIGQAPDGCYDAAAPSALVARGGDCGPPPELARRLAERWRS